MKPKLILCLVLVLSGAFLFSFASQKAYGYEVLVQLNHTNLIKDFPFLQISAVRSHSTNNETVFFTVTVIPKDQHQPENFTGTLAILDSHFSRHAGFIASTSVKARIGLNLETVPKALRSKCVSFQFLVSAKYLETSEFSVEEVPYKMASSTDYSFNLKEFADEK